jgi:hypothetical protein
VSKPVSRSAGQQVSRSAGRQVSAVEKAMKKGQSLFKLQPFIFVRKQLFIE